MELGIYGVLSAATRVPGELLASMHKAAERFGIVAPGYWADLLLLDSNPPKDPTTLCHPQGVMLRAR
jgi:imidazolonepropionase-like amidohydrolase